MFIKLPLLLVKIIDNYNNQWSRLIGSTSLILLVEGLNNLNKYRHYNVFIVLITLWIIRLLNSSTIFCKMFGFFFKFKKYQITHLFI